MIEKFIVFLFINCYIHIINIPFYLINKYIIMPPLIREGQIHEQIVYSDDLIVILVFIAFISSVIVVSIKHIQILFIYIIIHNIFVFFSWFTDDLFDGEFIYTYTTSICRLVQMTHLMYFFIDDYFWWNVLNRLNWTFLYSSYLFFIFYSFRYMLSLMHNRFSINIRKLK